MNREVKWKHLFVCMIAFSVSLSAAYLSLKNSDSRRIELNMQNKDTINLILQEVKAIKIEAREAQLRHSFKTEDTNEKLEKIIQLLNK